MTEQSTLEPARERPVLPENRERATALLSTLRERSVDAESMAISSGLDWAGRLLRRKYRGADVDVVINAVGRAVAALRDAKRDIDIAHLGHLDCPQTAAPVLAELTELTEDHVSAAISAQFSEMDQDSLRAMLADVKHLMHLESSLKEVVDPDLPEPEADRSLREAAAAAESLRNEFSCDTLETAAECSARLEAEGPSVERKVRRLTVLAARLDMPDASIGDLARIAKVCAHARTLPRDLLLRVGETAPELEETLAAAKQKAERIIHAGALLDGRIGTAWRTESFDTLSKASSIADIPGHPGHAKVGAYARGIGIAVNIRDTLDAVVKTRSGQASFERSPLRRSMPRSFKGLDTDFAAIDEAIAARHVLDDMLKDLPGGDRVLAAIGSSHSLVVDEFIAFAELADDATSLPFDPSTPLRRVRMLHDDRIRRLAALTVAVENLPVAPDLRTPADARRLGRIVRDMDDTRSRIEARPERAMVAGSTGDQLLRADGWRQRLFAVLPESARPSGDSGFAQLHVHARAAAAACKEALAALATLSGLLPPEIVPAPTTGFDEAISRLEEIRAAEPVLHAQVLVCEGLDAVMHGGLDAFVERMGRAGIPSSKWLDRLAEDYVLLDRYLEEDAFAASLAAAASDAQEDSSADPDVEPVANILPIGEFDGWVEEVVSFSTPPAMSSTRVVEIDEPPRQVAE